MLKTFKQNTNKIEGRRREVKGGKMQKKYIYIKEVRTKEKMRQTKTRQKDKEKENEINEVRQMRRKAERFRKVETRSERKKGEERKRY